MNNYQDYGFDKALPAHTFTYLQQPLLSLLDKEKNRCILDLGCGNGYLATLLLQLGYDAYGTDASEKGIAIAKEKNPSRFFLQELSTGRLPAELQELPFDTIISTEVIEHLYDPDQFIAFCKELLMPKGGTLLLSTPYHGYLKNLSLSLFDKWDAHMPPTWRGGHIKLWSIKTLSSLLTQHGFKVTAVKGCGRFPYFWKSMLIAATIE